MAAVILVVLAGGCSADSPSPRPPSTSAGVSSASTTASDGAPHSPLTRLTDPNDGEFLDESVETILDAQGAGPTELTLPGLEDIETVTFYVSCAPDSDFRVDAVENLYSGGCAQDFANSGTFPVRTSGARQDTQVRLAVPAETRFHIVAVPDIGDYR